MEAASSMKDLSRKPNPFVELGHRIRKHPWLYAMIVPTIVYFILFQYYPMLGIVIAFKKFTLKGGMFGGEWEGLKYFLKLFNDNTFWRVFRNTVIISTGKVLIGFPLPILIALLLNEFRSSAVKRTVQTIIYLPRFLSWVILGGILLQSLCAGRRRDQSVAAHRGQRADQYSLQSQEFPLDAHYQRRHQGRGMGKHHLHGDHFRNRHGYVRGRGCGRRGKV